jgi:hypothetical protein
MKRKNYFLVSQKQAKMKPNKIRFASFRFEAKIKKERKRDTLLGNQTEWFNSIVPVKNHSFSAGDFKYLKYVGHIIVWT